MLRTWVAGCGRLLVCVLSVSVSACIGAAGVPGGPLQGTGVSLGESVGYALAPARLTRRSAVDGSRRQSPESSSDAVNLPILPSRLGGRVGLTDWFDFAADASWLDSGLELRVGVPEGSQPFPFALAVGMRKGAWGVFDGANRHASEERVRFEAYPNLANLRGTRVNLIATAGVSAGRRYHPVLGTSNSTDQEGFLPTFDSGVLRNEWRAEASLGVELRRNRTFLSLIVMPYAVAHSGAASSICADCAPWQLESYQSSAGGAIFLSMGITFAHERLKVRAAEQY